MNRQSNSHTWRPTEEEEVALFEAYKDGAETEFKSIVHFDHKCKGGNSIDIVMSLEMSHVPTLKVGMNSVFELHYIDIDHMI